MAYPIVWRNPQNLPDFDALVSCLINNFIQFCHSRLSGILLLKGERFWTSQNDTTQKCKELLQTGSIQEQP